MSDELSLSSVGSHASVYRRLDATHDKLKVRRTQPAISCRRSTT
jgi:hypothetical protein